MQEQTLQGFAAPHSATAAGRSAAALHGHAVRGHSSADEVTHELGAIIVNGRGAVIRCNSAALDMFDGWPGELDGLSVSTLLPEIARSDVSPSFNQRHLGYLSDDGGWRRLRAVDLFDRPFPVDVCAARVHGEADDLFLLSLRQPAEW